MNISDISVTHMLGLSSAEIEVYTPITLFCGPNASGKSSLCEAVRAAFLGVTDRVAKKKDFDQLVHDGQKAGGVVVDFDAGQASFRLPSGEHEIKHDMTMSDWSRIEMALPYCLDPGLFARSTPDERRQLLMEITGASAKTADIVDALHKRGVDTEVSEFIKPMLRSGFPAAAKFAEEECRQAKADWRAVTKEVYGHKKADGWMAVSPEVDLSRLADLESQEKELQEKIAAEQQRLGAAEQKLKAWIAYRDSAEADRKAFARLASLEKKLEHDQQDLLKWSDQVRVLETKAGAGPRVGLMHDLARAVNGLINEQQPLGFDRPTYLAALSAMEAYETQFGDIDAEGDPEAAAQLPDAIKSRDLMQRAVDNTKRDIDATKAAGARLENAVEEVNEADILTIKESLANMQEGMQEVVKTLRVLRAAQREVSEAKDKTKRAGVAHGRAQAWQLAADALSPSGIPSEILAKALDPVNARLAKIAGELGWPPVVIDNDMMIGFGERLYGFLSESEQWRTDVCIGLAFASLSDARLVAIDRMDVLEPRSRGSFIDALDAVGTEYVDTALVFGTLKALPNLEQFPNVSAIWIDEGSVSNTEKEDAA